MFLIKLVSRPILVHSCSLAQKVFEGNMNEPWEKQSFHLPLLASEPITLNTSDLP